MHDIAYLTGGSEWNQSLFYRVKPLAPIRYLLQGLVTTFKLLRTRPLIVIAQNPPIFAPLTCLFYRLLTKTRLVVDHHCIWSEKTITYPIARNFIRLLEKVVARWVDLNVTPNPIWTQRVLSLGAKKAITLIDFVNSDRWDQMREDESATLGGGRTIVVAPCGGHPLERPEILMEAIRNVDAVLIVTGDEKLANRLKASFRKHAQENVVITGYLSESKYAQLIRTCTAVANISDEPNTIPYFIYEAISTGRPVISSDNPAIRSVFDNYLLIVQRNTPELVRKALLDALGNFKKYSALSKEVHLQVETMRRHQESDLFLALSEYITALES